MGSIYGDVVFRGRCERGEVLKWATALHQSFFCRDIIDEQKNKNGKLHGTCVVQTYMCIQTPISICPQPTFPCMPYIFPSFLPLPFSLLLSPSIFCLLPPYLPKLPFVGIGHWSCLQIIPKC